MSQTIKHNSDYPVVPLEDAAPVFVDSLNMGIAAAERGMDLMENIVNVYQRSKEINRDINLIQASKEVELKRLASQFELCREVIQGTFGQRQEGLIAHYKVLDKAIETDDREMIVAALRGISSIVTSNPLESYSKFLEAWNDKSKPLELDF